MRRGYRVAIPVPIDEPATEIRLLHAGVNRWEVGEVLFDEHAARAVAAAFARRGVDVMIDLEHRSLDPTSPAYDPDSLGWGRIEIRPGPELWLAGVRWTEDGARRIREKRQRYISPVIEFDSTRKSTPRAAGCLINAALTAMPATRHAQPLIAAFDLGGKMDPAFLATVIESAHPGVATDIVSQLAKLLGLPDSATFAEINAAITAVLQTVTKAQEVINAPAGNGQSEQLPQGVQPKEVEEMKAVASLLGCKNGQEVIAKLRASQAGGDAEQRKQLVATLLKMGIETPVSAYAAGGNLVARLQTEPLQSMRDRIAASINKPLIPPLTHGANEFGLTTEQLAICKKTGCDPAKFAEYLRKAGLHG